ncbi:hypothetical protein PM082_018716 [Marasmius tenuissimus]|nr:hypothetical protein PM082_018716 [Marasmius tenuissimus]
MDDPTTFEFVWKPTILGKPQERGFIVDSTDPTTSGNATELLYPNPGQYRLAIFSVPRDLASDLLFTSTQEILVEDLANSDSGELGSSMISDTVTTNNGQKATSLFNANLAGATPLPSNTTSQDQRFNVSDPGNSAPVPVFPIVIGAIGGVLTMVLLAFILRCYLRKRRSKGQGLFDINPFATRSAAPRILPPVSDSTAPLQHPQQPDIYQESIAARSIDHDADTDAEAGHLPIYPQYTENTTFTPPAIQDDLEEPNIAPPAASTTRTGMAMFTTDELVVELNQRLQEEGRWKIDESLPGILRAIKRDRVLDTSTCS